LGLGDRRGTEWTSLRIWEARGRRCQPRRAAPVLGDVVRSLSRGAGAVEAAPGATCSRAAREVAAAPGHAAAVPQPTGGNGSGGGSPGSGPTAVDLLAA